MDEFVAYRDVP